MARKNVLVTQLAAAQSLSASFNSPPTVIRYLDNVSYQINITTTNSTGTFNIQGSDDYFINESTNKVENPGNWINIPLSTAITAGAANDTILVSLNQLPFYAVRLSYTSTIAGTGVCDIFLTIKEIGG